MSEMKMPLAIAEDVEYSDPVSYSVNNMKLLQNYVRRIRSGLEADPDQLRMLLDDSTLLVDQTLAALARVDDNVNQARTTPCSVPSQPQTLNVNSLIGAIIHDLCTEIPRACDVDLNLGTLPDITCNKEEIKSVILEALLNTGLEDERADTTVMVTTERMGEFVLIAVDDNGTEMNEADIEEFLCPGAENSEYYAHCREIIAAHNGEINITSSEDEGTCVDILLPIDSL